MLFGGAAVVHGKGVHVQRNIATGQRTKIDALAGHLQTQHRRVDALGQIEPGKCVGIQALALGRRRWHGAKDQGAGEESVFALAFDGIKVVLAKAQQTQVALEDVAVGDTAAHREGGVYEGVEIDALEILANQGQTGLVAQVVG